jgi:hypothetical protein
MEKEDRTVAKIWISQAKEPNMCRRQGSVEGGVSAAAMDTSQTDQIMDADRMELGLGLEVAK